MTKKHFAAIAAIIRDARNVTGAPSAESEMMRVWIAQDLAREFAGWNSQFDRAKFMVSCEVKS